MVVAVSCTIETSEKEKERIWDTADTYRLHKKEEEEEEEKRKAEKAADALLCVASVKDVES